MAEVKIRFANSQEAERFVRANKDLDLFVWNIHNLERELWLRYAAGLDLQTKNTLHIAYMDQQTDEVNRWICWMLLEGFDVTNQPG